MATFTKDTTAREPFGKNAYLRSTQDVKTESFTFAQTGIPYILVDGEQTKILQPGTVIATITSGPDTGLVGVFQSSGTDEIQRVTPGGTATGGTFTINVLGATTSALAFDASAATIQTAVRAAIAASNVSTEYKLVGEEVTVTGGPMDSAFIVITYVGAGLDVPEVLSDDALLTGTSPTLTDSTPTPGVAGATDGRETTANIVGVTDTFVPWQLTERDTDIAVVYEATVVQTWCIEYTGNTPGALGNTTRDAMIALAATKNISYK